MITLLASDERFQLEEVGGDAPMVQMRGLETLSRVLAFLNDEKNRGGRFCEFLMIKKQRADVSPMILNS